MSSQQQTPPTYEVDMSSDTDHLALDHSASQGIKRPRAPTTTSIETNKPPPKINKGKGPATYVPSSPPTTSAQPDLPEGEEEIPALGSIDEPEIRTPEDFYLKILAAMTLSNEDHHKRMMDAVVIENQHLHKKVQGLEKKVDRLTSLVETLVKGQQPQHHQPPPIPTAPAATPKPNVSFSQALTNNKPAGTKAQKQPAQTTKPTQKTNQENITKAQRRFIITRNVTTKPTKEPVEVRNVINSALQIAKAPATVKVASVTPNDKGNYVILTTENCTAAQVLQYRETVERAARALDDSVVSFQSTESWHKVIVHGIPTAEFPDITEGMKDAKEEIEEFNVQVQLMALPRYLTSKERRGDKAFSSLVLAVQSKEIQGHLVKHGLIVRGRHRKVTEFFSVRPTDQCSRCQKFGHQWSTCERSPACRLCAAEHTTNDHKCKICTHVSKGSACAHTLYLCANCNGNHKANDPNCETIKAIRARYDRQSAQGSGQTQTEQPSTTQTGGTDGEGMDISV